MPIDRPPLLQLGGEESFDAYRREFARLYRASPIIDVLGHRVIFPSSAARHVCFKSAEEDLYHRGPREIWSQERAERIPWILTALQTPDEIRPNHQDPIRPTYLLTILAAPERDCPQERYGVFVDMESADTAIFLTAFPMDESYWKNAIRGGRRLYPPPDLPKKKPQRKRRR